MTPTDFHVLLVLTQGSLYGYTIMKTIDEESDGSITPEIGSLYRVLARLVSQGFVEQVDSGPVEGEQVHPWPSAQIVCAVARRGAGPSRGGREAGGRARHRA
jgi:hypothetical protein